MPSTSRRSVAVAVFLVGAATVSGVPRRAAERGDGPPVSGKSEVPRGTDHPEARPRPAPKLSVGVGTFNLVDHPDARDTVRLEYRSTRRAFGSAKLQGSLTFGDDDALFVALGWYWDLRLGRRVVFTPTFSAGYLADGDKAGRFGGALQFKTGVELAYEFSNGHRLGAALQHISDLGIHPPNLGVNNALLTYTVPLGRRRGPGRRAALRDPVPESR